MTPDEITLEQLAELEHDQWAHWTRYMLRNLTPENIQRWMEQCDTPYSELTEKEKDSDREWAQKALAIADNENAPYLECPDCGDSMELEREMCCCGFTIPGGVTLDMCD